MSTGPGQPSEAAIESLAAARASRPSPRAAALAGADPDLAPLLFQQEAPPALRLSAAAWWDMLVESVSAPIAILRSQGVPVWAWKGFVYARTLYPAPWTRPMRDVDLLVRRVDFDAVTNSFVSTGWSATSPIRPLLTSGIVSSITLSRGVAMVDLHSSPSYFPCLIPGVLPPDLLELREEISPGLYRLSPEHSLATSAIHFLSHRPPRQIWWVDLALLSEAVGREGSWMAFSHCACRTGLGNRIGSVLSIIRNSMGIRVPREVTDALSRSSDRGRLFGLAAEGRGRPSVSAALCSRGWQKASFVAALLYRAAMRLPASRPERTTVRRDIEHD